METSKKRMNVPKLTVEIDEDEILNSIAAKRDTKDAKFIVHAALTDSA